LTHRAEKGRGWRRESPTMTIFWIIVMVLAVAAIVWLVGRRRRAA
jgi:uncharacterized membrane protein